MSYARFGEGDVYAFCSSRGYECVGCALADSYDDPVFDTPAALLDHLEDHRHHGHMVPDRAFSELEKELAA